MIKEICTGLIRIQTCRRSQIAQLFFSLAILFFLAAQAINAQEKIRIGEVEDVILLPWGVKLPARIDTGAAISSLVARELTVHNNEVEFRLPQRYGGLKIRLPIMEWQDIRSNQGLERRPMVEIEVCLGPRRLRTPVTLDDRTGLKYPFLVGRNILKENFVVDCTQSNCFPPRCPEAPSK